VYGQAFKHFMRPVYVVPAEVEFRANVCDSEARNGRMERLLFPGNDSGEEANLE
jgi:hypothetical protein